MDTWTDAFTDDKGVRRCRRCQHARPTKNQDIPQVAVKSLGDLLSNMQNAVQNAKK
jgi:hypothetical protein